MEPIKFLKDKNAIHFKVEDIPLPQSVKKFRQTFELKSFYKFIHENDLRKEAFQIINNLFKSRKSLKQRSK